MMQKIFSHTGIGEVVYTKRVQSRTIKISVSRSRGVRVSLPLYTSYAKAAEFVEANLERIRKLLQKPERAKVPGGDPMTGVLPEENRVAAGATDPDRKRTPGIHPDGGVGGGSDRSGDASYGLHTPKELAAIRKRAHQILPVRLAEISEKLNATILVRNKLGIRRDKPFAYNRLAIKNNRTNWGSCSSARNINLNMHLVNLPPELMNFVIIHELCHLVYPNHGPRFHALVDAACNGREQELSRALKAYRPS